MKIEITYKRKNPDSTNVFELTPEQYYQPITKNENYEDDSITKYNKTINYIRDFNSDIHEHELEYSIISIKGSIKSDEIIKTTYFGNESELIYSIDFQGRELIIQSIRVAENCLVITRMERADSNSDWTNINYSTGVNYKKEDTENEKWYSAHNGKYMRKNI